MGGTMSQNETTDNPIVSNISTGWRGSNKAHMWRMAFFGLVILVAGIVIGGSSMLIFAPDKVLQPPPGPEFNSFRMIPPLQRALDLDPEQAKKIQPILDKYMQKLNTIRTEARSEIAETLKQMNQDIASILTDGQKQLWQREIRQLQDELHPRGGPGPGWGQGRGGPPFRGGQQQRLGRGPGRGPFGPRREPTGPNTPQDGINNGPAQSPQEPPQ